MRSYPVKIAFFSILSILFFLVQNLSAQNGNALGQQDLKVITTGVPFLMIAPDARAGAMGDAGVSSAPDANSVHWNPAKLAFIDKEMGFAISYSPWLRSLVPDISLAYVTGYKRLDDKQAIGMSLLYFSLGDITFTSDIGDPVGNYRPNEFAIDGSYARKFTKNISGAVSARFIHSNLTLRQYVSGTSTKPGNSVAADVAVYSRNPVTFDNMEGVFAWGINISNIGSKISYSDDNTRKDFIPTNLRFGPSLTLDFDDYNSMSFMVDINKLLVPTPDSTSLDDPPGVPVGMLQSFYDAPGGFGEEMREFSVATGVEYWYDKQFALRGGFFYEDAKKGDRKFFSLGAGLKYNVFGLDFSYLIPLKPGNPLENTLRFSLLFDFAAFGDQEGK